jgi:serine/threonine-protein kinase
MSEFDAGDIIDGRYQVLHRLGAGGMADVYLARDQQLDREVALKLLHRRFAEDPGFVERFRREAQAAASLQHPNVVSVFDRGSFEGTYYIAMEYLPGRTLKQLIRDEAPIEVERAIDIAIQVLKAARFAHRRGVIHRDLKPHNVIVDDNDQVKVTDFGIARAGASDMTETGSIMGTAQYLSPEQAQGHSVSEPSDLYSIGIVLYEMLTGRVPFDGESPVSIALKHVSEAPVPPSHINPEVPAALEQVIMWALNKDAVDRPNDADQFIMALEQVRESLATPAIERTASMPAVSLVPVPAASASGYPHTSLIPAPATAVAYGAEPAPGGDGGRSGQYRDERRRAPRWPWLLALLLVLLLGGGGAAAFVLTRPQKALVPYVVGLQEASAQTQLTNAGFTASVIDVTSNSAQGEVIAQSPRGSARERTGSTVTLNVSSGPAQATVPDVSTLSEKAAKQQLRQSGLKVSEVKTEVSSTVPQGEAVGTQPASGASLVKGDAVVLYMSSGLAMPNVVGDNLGEAQSALAQFTTTPKTLTQTTTTASPGTVIAQSPASGQPVSTGEAITLTVAKAPDTVRVPRVVGDTPAQALQTLITDGLTVNQVHKTTHNLNVVGLVIKQFPTSTSIVKKGAVVTISIGQAPASSTTTQAATTTAPTTS